MEKSSALDTEIQRSVWNAVIPIELKLASDDLATPVAPDPYYLLAPRIGYLPVVTNVAESYFLESVASRFDGMWFKCNNIPLKWHLPVGVLYDLYGEGKLPWSIEVNFQNFPEKQLQRWESEASLKSHFMNNLKEANHLKDKNNTAINSLSKDDQTNLWESVKNQEYKKFWDIYPMLGKSVDTIKFVPIRIIAGSGTLMMRPFSSMKPGTEELMLLSDFMESLPQFADHQPVIHGIVPPPETPIVWLAYHCAYPDNFLYITLVKKSLQ